MTDEWLNDIVGASSEIEIDPSMESIEVAAFFVEDGIAEANHKASVEI